MLAYKENHVDTTSKDVVDNMEKGFSLFFLKYTRLGFRAFAFGYTSAPLPGGKGRVFRCFRNSIILEKNHHLRAFFIKKRLLFIFLSYLCTRTHEMMSFTGV